MHKRLIVNACPHETRVALLENGTIVKIYIQRKDESDIVGNIYKGKVQRVLPGMQAAFVDIGLSQAAFLYVSDVIDPSCKDIEPVLTDINGGDQAEGPVLEESGIDEMLYGQNAPIESLLTEGQDVMVHVSKASIGTKGARVTMHVSLPGRYLVMMPTSTHIGISRRIEDETERARLKEMVEAIRDENIGYIVRTASEGINDEKIVHEIGFLKNLWHTIQKRYQKYSAPKLLHKELDVSIRAVRDLLTEEADNVVIDSRKAYDVVMAFLDSFMPGLKNSVELYQEPEPIFDAYNIETDVSRAMKKKVWLKSGGYIIIEQTEALVAIDVNTGRYVGSHNLEETIVKTNLDAAREIAYQIQLRDIGGIIIIDFIDMEKKSNQEKVFTALREALSKDTSKTNILPMSEFGLIQMTRKRIKKSLNTLLCEPCFYCEGEGVLMSKKSICFKIYRKMLKDAKDMAGKRFTLRVNPLIADLLHGEERYLMSSLEKLLEKQILIYPTPRFHLEQFDIFEMANGTPAPP